MRRVLAGLLFAIVVPWHRLSAQVQFGSTNIGLGQERNPVIAKLRQYYRVDTLPSSGDQWVVSSRKGPPYQFVGNLAFKAGKLSYISKAWSPGNDRDGSAVARAVVNALRSLAGSSDSGCTMKNSEISEPTLEAKTVEVRCGAHSVSISTPSADGKIGMGINETWRLEGF
jgi:hypothetical protein